MGWSDLGKKPLLFFRSGAEKLGEASEKWESSQALGSPPLPQPRRDFEILSKFLTKAREITRGKVLAGQAQGHEPM